MRRLVMYAGFLLLIAHLIAAPAPAPSVQCTIDLVKSPKGMTMETYRNEWIDGLRSKRIIDHLVKTNGDRMVGEGVAQLQIIKDQQDAAAAWLVENLKCEPVGKTTIRVRFTAGSKKDQAVIIDAAVTTFLLLGPPSRWCNMTRRVETMSWSRTDLVEYLESAEARLAKMNEKVKKVTNDADVAKAIAYERAIAVRKVAEAKDGLKEFDAVLKALQAELDNAPAPPIIRRYKEPGSRSNSDLFSGPSAKDRENTDASPKNREKGRPGKNR